MKGIKDNLIILFLYIINTSIYTIRNFVSKSKKIGFVVEEYFHEDLRGFGGYGISAKRQANFLNTSEDITAEVLLSSIVDNDNPEIRIYHDTNVVLRPGRQSKGSYVLNFLRYAFMVNLRGYKALLCTDWYKSYEYIARALPSTPIIIWIRDPRSKRVWERIMSVPMEKLVNGDIYSECDTVKQITENKKESFQRILQLSKRFKRKITFVTAAEGLIERAQDAYGLDSIKADFLPNTIEMYGREKPDLFERPSLCFIGRLEPVKRPWIFFEMAKRFPEVDFYVAGTTIYPEVIEPVINRYRHLENLKFLGLVTGEEKKQLLGRVWALFNCSSSEGMPVTFMESFSYGKPVISCYEIDGLLDRFGYYTGEVNGEGLDEESLQKFERAIRSFLADKEAHQRKGEAARKFAEDRYTFENFEKKLRSQLMRI